MIKNEKNIFKKQEQTKNWMVVRNENKNKEGKIKE